MASAPRKRQTSSVNLGEAADHPLARDMNWLLHRAALGFGDARNEALANFGLTVREQVVLNVLDEVGAMPQLSLAALIGLDKSVLTNTIDALETRQLVQRMTDPADRRARMPVLTTTGRRLSRRAAKAVETGQEQILAELPQPTRDELLALLHHFVFVQFTDSVSTDEPDR
jgi:DNA-binding MarR family transcriptional regulator